MEEITKVWNKCAVFKKKNDRREASGISVPLCFFLEVEQFLWKTGSLAISCEQNQGSFSPGYMRIHCPKLILSDCRGKKKNSIREGSFPQKFQ